MTSFVANHGYLDGLLRGYRSGLLTAADYANLTQCETVDDMKVHLMNTDYANVFQDLPSPLTTQSIAEACTRKMVEDFQSLRQPALEPLAKFLDYITYGYMIDNIVLILSETLHERGTENPAGDTQALLDRCHPLGLFEGITALCVAQTPAELYHLVLVNSPLAKYFLATLSMENLDEMHVEVIRNLLYKEYLKDFFRFCQQLGEPTSESMGDILKFEADRRSINITVNSWRMQALSKPWGHQSIQLTRFRASHLLGVCPVQPTRPDRRLPPPSLPQDDRQRIYPTFGELWPEGTSKLQDAVDMDGLRAAVDSVEAYRDVLQQQNENPDKTIEDCFFEKEVQNCLLAFESHYSYGAFYAYFRLKEQETRNIVWIAECIAQNKRDRINHFTPTI
ncbi:putative V-type proton ATPase subunit d [Paratrimastix pyriformis]|uniref:V-type proton ATPase subunit n=1 Tax=Paratrimastix pyriformis TaxID=342808 RepID=A0ABQ8UM46_9EUKA|nr:putative V-type proton ATPase subunit d [Paratrimastix pyriformis]